MRHFVIVLVLVDIPKWKYLYIKAQQQHQQRSRIRTQSKRVERIKKRSPWAIFVLSTINIIKTMVFFCVCWFLLLFDIELNAVCVFVCPCRNCDLCILVSNCTTTASIFHCVVVAVFVFLTHEKIEYRFRGFCYVICLPFSHIFSFFF